MSEVVENEVVERPVVDAKGRGAFPGFFIRLGSFIIDMYLVYLILKFTAPALKPVYQSLGVFGYHIGFLIFALYFILCEGPLGKGQTLGKMVFNLRVVNRKLEPLSYGQAAMRVLKLVFFFFMMKNAVYPLITFEPALNVEFFENAYPGVDEQLLAIFGMSSPLIKMSWFYLVILTISLSIGNLVQLSLHPLRRSLHDLLADSYVIRLSVLDADIERQLESKPDQGKPVYLAFVAVAFLLPFVFGVLYLYRNMPLEDVQREAVFQKDFNVKFGIDGHTGVTGYYDFLMLPNGNRVPSEYYEELVKQLEEHQEYQKTIPEESRNADSGSAALIDLDPKDIPRLQLMRVIYYHFGSEEKNYQDVFDRVFEDCLVRYRMSEYPFESIPGKVEDLPSSAVLVMQVVDSYNVFLTSGWETDFLSSGVLTRE